MNRNEKIAYLAQYLTDGCLEAHSVEIATGILDKIFPPLPSIDFCPEMERYYLPLPGGYEVQTQGLGSTFRVANTISEERVIICMDVVQDFLTDMAHDIREAYGE